MNVTESWLPDRLENGLAFVTALPLLTLSIGLATALKCFCNAMMYLNFIRELPAFNCYVHSSLCFTTEGKDLMGSCY